MYVNIFKKLCFLISIFFVLDLFAQQVDPPTNVRAISGDSTFNCGDVFLGGFGYMDPYAGSYTTSVWKAFRFVCEESGTVNCFKIFVKDYVGDRTDDSVVVALYDDREVSGQYWPNNLMCYAYNHHYDWTIVGKWAYHVFPVNSLNPVRNVVEGQHYWLVMYSGPDDNIAIERGRVNTPNCPTWRVGYNVTRIFPPPEGHDYNYQFGAGDASCYGYSIW